MTRPTWTRDVRPSRSAVCRRVFRTAMEVLSPEPNPDPGRCWNAWEIASIHAVDMARAELLRVRVWRLCRPEIFAA